MVSEYVGIPISYGLTDAVPVGKFIDKHIVVYYTRWYENEAKCDKCYYI